MSNVPRLASANLYESALRNLGTRHTSLANLQENLTAGKRVLRASDDPVSAAQAERSLTRIARIQTEQRALDVQRNTIAQAESSLGNAIGLVQEIRELVVGAGNGTFNATDRTTIANQLVSLRAQLLDVANRKNTDGTPLLSALGSALAPFLDGSGFAGLPGQGAGSAVGIPDSLDGDSAFLFQPQRDGVYHVGLSNIPSPRALLTESVKTVDAALVTGDRYSIAFSGVGPGATPGTLTATYTLTNVTTGIASPPVTLADFSPNQPVTITHPDMPGLSIGFKGTPDNGDVMTLHPSVGIFDVVDRAIGELKGAGNGNAAAQAVGQALANLDSGLNRLQAVRSYAGELLNRADRISGNQEVRSVQLEADRSRAEDLDMIQGISDFQNQQVGYEAALKSYAMVQKLSLFNFIS